MTALAKQVVGRQRELELVRAALASGAHILLEGPPGTGKSTLLRQVAASRHAEFVLVEGSAELTPARLVGSFDPALVLEQGYRPENFSDGPLVRAMRDGGLLYVEELNRVPEETINVLLTVMSEGEINVPRLGRVPADESFRLVAAMNPYDSVGTSRLSMALYDRTCRIAVGYQDAEHERQIVQLAAARAKPGTINFASAAASTQLNAERFRRSAKFEAVHIPYKGAAEALNEVIAGRVDFYFSPIAPALPHIRDGKVVALAVGSAKRASILPDVPTTLEAGFPDSEYNFWLGLFAPARTPREIVKRMHDEAATALAVPEVRERLLKLGAEPMTMAPEQFDAYIQDELRLNAVLAKQAGLTTN